MADFFNNRPLVDRFFGHSVGSMTPSGEILDFAGGSTGTRVDTGAPSGDNLWITTIGRVDHQGRIVDIHGNALGIQIAPCIGDWK